MWWCSWPNFTACCDHFLPSALVPLLPRLWHLLEPFLRWLKLEENSSGMCKETWTDLFSILHPAPWKAFWVFVVVFFSPPDLLIESVWEWKARWAVAFCKNWIVASQVCRNGGGRFREMGWLFWQQQVIKVNQWNWVSLFKCKFFSCFPKHFSWLSAIHV